MAALQIDVPLLHLRTHALRLSKREERRLICLLGLTQSGHARTPLSSARSKLLLGAHDVFERKAGEDKAAELSLLLENDFGVGTNRHPETMLLVECPSFQSITANICRRCPKSHD